MGKPSLSTVAAPSELNLIVSRRYQPCPDGCLHVHSYTADDRRWCLRTPGWDGLDVELIGDPPVALARRLHSNENFWLAWTRLEVIAKLTNQPVLTLVAKGLLGVPPPQEIAVQHLALPGVMACVGRSRLGRRASSAHARRLGLTTKEVADE